MLRMIMGLRLTLHVHGSTLSDNQLIHGIVFFCHIECAIFAAETMSTQVLQ